MLKFDEDKHIYFDKDKQYQSVTQFIKKFIKPFKKELIAEKVAKKQGKTTEDVIKGWDNKGKVSSQYGNSIHKAVENWIKFDVMDRIPHVKDAVEKFSKKYNREEIESEIAVYDKKRGIAGTIDLFINGNVIGDLKTSTRLNKSYGRMLPPFDDLKDTKINKYRLQLSIYKALSELQGIDIDKLFVEHWDGKEWNKIDLEPIDQELILKVLNK